jgi:beta-phosphoglucomutase-like phosphatase (HAD superfamily)
LYLDAARRLGFDPAACLGVEDTAVGIAAVRGAGAIPVWIPNVPMENTDQAIVLPSLETLSELIEAAKIFSPPSETEPKS